MKRFLPSLLLFALLFVTHSAVAQDSRTITLQEAIDIALENNYQLKQAKNNLDLAEYRVKSEYADFLPSVNSSINGSRRTGQQFISDRFSEGLDPFVDITSKSISGNMSANIPVFRGFENINSLRASQQSKISEEESFQRAKEQVIFNTASNYLQVLLAMELLEIRKENLENSRKQLEQVQAQVEVGSRPTVDLYNQEAQVANDELLLTQQENTLKFNKLLLIRQLQIDPLGDYEFEIPEIEAEVSSASMQSYSLSELIDQALLSRSDLKSAIANIRTLDYQLSIAKGSLYPSVSASFGLSSSYSDQYSVLGESVGFSDQFFDQRINRSLGFSVSIPLFQNWNRMTSIQSTKVQLKNAELNLDNSRLQVIQEVTQAYNDYSSYVQQLSASEKSLKASERAFETQQERYNVGSSTLIELSQAQANYVSAQSDYTQAIYNLIFQEKLLDYYLGKLSSETVEF
ncbi:TolC family protein [Gracilimonas amylolytica]|uniref:TolC family protein n=1 Tax=Gracilimonas amylolytica TaxID=1749045 RepID=UPI000CD995DB|nr:TolC family protein [Gracilimonas amylolytica]